MQLSTMQRYHLSGLTILSAIPLPPLRPQPDIPPDVHIVTPDAPPDVHIVTRSAASPLPDTLPDAVVSGPFWTLTATALLLSVPGLGRLLATNGTRLEIEPAPGVPLEDLVPFVLGTGLAGLLYQRGTMLLHAAAVADGDRALLLCGDSGLGKSTLAAALCQQGCRLICDDLARITLPPGADRNTDPNTGSRPVIWPDGRALKLFPPSITRLDLHDRQGPAVRPDIDKYYVTPPEDPIGAPPTAALPVGVIYLLVNHQPDIAEGLTPVTGLDAAHALLQASFRPRLALGMARAGVSTALQQLSPVLQAQVPIYTLVRPRDLSLLDQQATTLLAHARQVLSAAGSGS